MMHSSPHRSSQENLPFEASSTCKALPPPSINPSTRPKCASKATAASLA
eukprot:CAMPEP_0198555620 /NCGR_PEP_ID=MMETSP1462-20131121/85143_1 /TAXON_ID=1333877 /ORGANISM="Brandtodinium nutriculum, Strain RCC3387" /LENGTH=48 /DNA_ID= /DNA_START= /DNA_END= /DNA_ORIENTATION=